MGEFTLEELKIIEQPECDFKISMFFKSRGLLYQKWKIGRMFLPLVPLKTH